MSRVEGSEHVDEAGELYMVIERFKPGAAAESYRRLRSEGRRLYEGSRTWQA